MKTTRLWFQKKKLYQIGINSEISYEVYGKFIEIKGISAKDLGTDLVISGANNECIAKFSYLDLIYSKSYSYANN